MLRFFALCLALGLAPGVQAELDPIDAYVRTKYPAEFATAREAVLWLLEDTGWQLAEGGTAPADAGEVLARPIDPIAQLPRTMTRLDAIQVLIGMDRWIVLDRKNHLISFTRGQGR